MSTTAAQSTPERLADYYRSIAPKYPPAMARAILERAAEHDVAA